MKRAFLLEMTIFRDYARQLVGLGLLVSLCIGLGMQTPLAMPATLTCMFFMMSAMGLAAYDQLNHWELFRLTLPLSRRDVVLGRYAAIVTFGLLGMVVGLVAALAATGVVSAVGLPGEVGEAFAFDPDMLSVMAVVTCFTLLIGSVVASVVTPLYFRLGQTRATQILPTVIVLLFVVPVAWPWDAWLLSPSRPWRWRYRPQSPSSSTSVASSRPDSSHAERAERAARTIGRTAYHG